MKSNGIFNGIVLLLSLSLSGCLTSNDTLDGSFSKDRLYVFGTDFTSGQLKWLQADAQEFDAENIDVHSDSKLISYKGYIYILERFGADNIFKLNPSKKGDASIVYQTHLGDNWNPQDMAFVSDSKAYVAVENVPYILIFDPKEGKIKDSILTRDYIYEPGENDSGYAATSPHCHSLAIHDGYLYAALQRRNGDWAQPGGKAKILKIDIEDNEIVSEIDMAYGNSTALRLVDGYLYVSTLGKFENKSDGAIERINLETEKTEILFEESDFEANIYNFVHKEGMQFYALSYVSWGNVGVKLLDLKNKKVLKSLPKITDAGSDLLYDSNTQRLFITEREPTASGIKIFDNKENFIAGPLEMDVPPSSLTLVEPQP